jgi:RND family efflux transporter MFP subunit
MKNTFIYPIAFLSILLLVACGNKQVEKKKPLRPVVYEVVKYEGDVIQRTFSGTASSYKVVNLSFRNSGRIVRLNMKLGQTVKKGDVLAELDNVQANLSYESAKANLASAESQWKTTELNFDRVKALYEKGGTSLSNYEQAKNSFRSAKSSYESAQQNVKNERERIQFGYIYAPQNGTISRVDAEIDENISAGQAVGVLNVSGDMIVEIGVPEGLINAIQTDMETTISFPALNNPKGAGNTSFKGKVLEVAQAVSNTAVYPVKVGIQNPSSLIKSGMAANVAFQIGEKQQNAFLVVPAKGVGEDSYGRFVFVLEEEQKEGETEKRSAFARKAYIEIGPLNQGYFQIISGLVEGQKIAVAGLQTLLDGQQVKLSK